MLSNAIIQSMMRTVTSSLSVTQTREWKIPTHHVRLLYMMESGSVNQYKTNSNILQALQRSAMENMVLIWEICLGRSEVSDNVNGTCSEC